MTIAQQDLQANDVRQLVDCLVPQIKNSHNFIYQYRIDNEAELVNQSLL